MRKIPSRNPIQTKCSGTSVGSFCSWLPAEQRDLVLLGALVYFFRHHILSIPKISWMFLLDLLISLYVASGRNFWHFPSTTSKPLSGSQRYWLFVVTVFIWQLFVWECPRLGRRAPLLCEQIPGPQVEHDYLPELGRILLLFLIVLYANFKCLRKFIPLGFPGIKRLFFFFLF